jgi:hypothetical protein
MMAEAGDASDDDGPPYLYKFRSLASKDQLRLMIANSKLWYAKPSTFNDPFDFYPKFSMEGTNEEVKGFAKEVLEQAMSFTRQERKFYEAVLRDPRKRLSPYFQNLLSQRRLQRTDKYGVCSLSADPHHMLMWAHYAASHTGVCLRFKRNRAGPYGLPFGAAQPVIYSSTRPVVNPITDHPDAMIEAALLTKADFWKYEREWRLISYETSTIGSPGGPGLGSFNPGSLDAIILGARISAADAADVKQWVSGRPSPVQILQARLHPDLFSMEILPAG